MTSLRRIRRGIGVYRRVSRHRRAVEIAGGALVVWVLSRAVVALVAAVSADDGWGGGWYHWDVALYIKVAEYGYGGYPLHYPDQGIAAFFPGLPLVLHAVHCVVGSWVWCGLLVSAVAGAVAAVALSRLTERDAPRGAGPAAVLALVVSPYAVFLAAGYSEALFLGFALPAWLAARRRAWAAAGLLAAGASTVRVTGVFLAVALVVEYAAAHRRLRPDAGWLAVPFLPPALFVLHLHHVLGDWFAWSHAEASMWGRELTAPWTALHTTWTAAWAAYQPADFRWQFRADIVALAVGVVLTVALLAWRRWGEAVYVGLQVIALGTSSFYLSIGRATLLWWPLWVLLGRAAVRHRVVFTAYVVVAAPLMVLVAAGFVNGRWVG